MSNTARQIPGRFELFSHLFAVAVAPLRAHPVQPHQSSDTSSNTDIQSCHFILADGPLLPPPPLPVTSHSPSARPFKGLPVISGRQSRRPAAAEGMNITEPLSSTDALFPSCFGPNGCSFNVHRLENRRFPKISFAFVWFALSFFPSTARVCSRRCSYLFISYLSGGGEDIAKGSVIVFIRPTGCLDCRNQTNLPKQDESRLLETSALQPRSRL